jgi:superfamily II RNA helicase
MTWPLYSKLQASQSISISEPEKFSESILDSFLEYIQEKGLELYPAQEEAILEIFSGKNVILNTPTGSGKSLVALALHFYSLAKGRRSFYTSPIKALVNEKFFALCKDFGPDQVGLITGDGSVNPEAPIICCTAEILAIDALREGASAPAHDIIMDEFHYYSDRERGVYWQVPLLIMSYSRFLLMSATMGDCEKFEKILSDLTALPTVTVQSTERPVPLDFQYSESPLHETVSNLISTGKFPIYLVSFTQRECAEEAQNFMSIELCTKPEKQLIAETIKGVKFSSPYGKELQKFLKHGMGIHHGGLLPKYRLLVEKLAQKGLLKIIFGTDTLGVGVNIPIRTVLFTKLCKYDGNKTSILTVRDFKQISGRAGRKGFDDQGTVVAQAPEHVIENKRNELKAAGDPKKLKKLVKKKPPEKGFLMWSQDTFQKLINGKSEPLTSRFRVNHAMLLNVLSRPSEDGCLAMKRIIKSSHETPQTKKTIRKSAFQMFRSLTERNIIEFNPLRVNVDLQEDFSLNHALSLYLVDTLQLLDPKSETYCLDILSLSESILESPDLILRKQLDRLKSAKMLELKQLGMEFDQRIEELDKMEHPKPLRDFIYETFNEFADKHPWIEKENIRPKSVAREIYEGFYSFGEYIREYELQRAEGILLRYLSDVYKVLVQNIPSNMRTEELSEIILYFSGLVHKVDSSLVNEWERMKTAGVASDEIVDNSAEEDTTQTISLKSLKIMARNEVYRFLKSLARNDWEECLDILSFDEESDSEKEFEKRTLTEVLRSSYQNFINEGYKGLRSDARLRNAEYFQIKDSEDKKSWLITQSLLDAQGLVDQGEEATNWTLEFEVNILESRIQKLPVIKFLSFSAQ